jgi:hypothetical protein
MKMRFEFTEALAIIGILKIAEHPLQICPAWSGCRRKSL